MEARVHGLVPVRRINSCCAERANSLHAKEDELDPLRRLVEAAEREAATTADGGASGGAPVERWNPSHCGDIGMEIRRDGSWWYRGSRIDRERLVKLFARILRKDDDSLHYLVTPVEKVVVHVETAPFLAVRLDVLGDEASPTLRFTTNVGDQVDAGPDRPIRVETDPATGEPAPFVLVRGRLEALMTRAVFFELVEHAREEPLGDGGRRWIARSRGAAFVLAQEDARAEGAPVKDPGEEDPGQKDPGEKGAGEKGAGAR